MNVSVERVGNEATVKITAPVEVVNQAFKDAVKKIANEVNIPGFRKGKAPRHIIEMHYGKDAIKGEAFEIVANKVYGEALNQENLIPVDEPKVENSVFEEGKELELVVKVTLKPEPELGAYKELHVEKEAPVVTDEQVEAQVQELRNRQAKMVVAPEGTVAVWPVTSKGKQCVWRQISERLQSDWNKGYIKITKNKNLSIGSFAMIIITEMPTKRRLKKLTKFS